MTKKLTKEQVHYRTGDDEEYCGSCTTLIVNRRAPNSCKIVEGDIYQEDTCDYYRRASDKDIIERSERIKY